MPNRCGRCVRCLSIAERRLVARWTPGVTTRWENAVGDSPHIGVRWEKTTLLDAETVVDLTDHVKDGVLEWTFPEGVW